MATPPGVTTAFQPSYQLPAYQNAPDPALEYGWTFVTATAQRGGYQPARSTFLAGSMCYVKAQYFDITGDPWQPFAVQWRMDDLTSQQNVIAWQPIILPQTENQVAISSVQNAMISYTRDFERRQVLFQVTDFYGNVAYARTIYTLVRDLGGFYVFSDGYQGPAFQPEFQQPPDVVES
jgi:hypothetical protein